MATAPRAARFKVSDLVKFNNSGEYIILAITNELGFNTYHIMDTKNGNEERANSHQLQKIQDLLLPSSDTEEEMEIVEEKTRFKLMTQEEIDELAKKRTEKATDKQTTWAIRIFKGK